MNAKLLTIPLAVTLALTAATAAKADDTARLTPATDTVAGKIFEDQEIKHGYAACTVRG